MWSFVSHRTNAADAGHPYRFPGLEPGGRQPLAAATGLLGTLTLLPGGFGSALRGQQGVALAAAPRPNCSYS
jgi:hypothetical protein